MYRNPPIPPVALRPLRKPLRLFDGGMNTIWVRSWVPPRYTGCDATKDQQTAPESPDMGAQGHTVTQAKAKA